MTIDLFDTRTMLEALDERFRPNMFLRDLFFNGASPKQHDTRKVDIDIRKGKRRVAPYVRPIMEGKVVERLGFVTRTYEPPYLKPKMPTKAQAFLKRRMGGVIYGPNDGPAARAQMELGENLAELEDMCLRAEECQAAQLLETGKLVITGDGYEAYEIDFNMSASHIITLSGTDLWSDAASQPLEFFRTLKRLVMKDSGLMIDVCIMGTDALDAFLKNANVKDQLDTRRIDLGTIDPVEQAEGVTYYGRIKDVNLNLYTYDEYYNHPTTGTVTSMIPAKKIIVGSTKAYCNVNYGAIEDLDAEGDYAVPRYPKSWREKDPSVQWLLLQSAPMLTMNQVDGFAVAQVLA